MQGGNEQLELSTWTYLHDTSDLFDRVDKHNSFPFLWEYK